MRQPGNLPQCWSPKKHPPHTWEDYSEPSGPTFECAGLTQGIRFIDKFYKLWSCRVPNDPCWKYISPEDTEHHTGHEECGWRWTAELTDDDMERLALAFDMSRADIKEFLES